MCIAEHFCNADGMPQPLGRCLALWGVALRPLREDNKKTVPQRRIAFERREQIYSCCTRGTTLIVADATSLHDQRVCVKQANGESLLRDNGQVPAMPTVENAISIAAPGPVTLYLPHRLAPTDGSLQRSGYGFLPIFAFELMRLF